MEEKFKLIEQCYVNSNEDENCFVGIKLDYKEAKVYFPIGYELPTTERELRKDILHLISILAEFSKPKYKTISIKNNAEKQLVDFPINAYLQIINYYMENNGYYIEKESRHKKSNTGNINWSLTVKKQNPLIQRNGSLVFTEYIVRNSSPNDTNLITQINKYCVYESFNKLGWIFTAFIPERPLLQKNYKIFLSVLYDKLRNTNNEKDKQLFLAMIEMIEFIDEKNDQQQIYYGTNHFEYVWEKLIDKAFGIKDKQKYFPKTRWLLKNDKNKINVSLEPDSIMIYNNKIYVLDAKYYRFGITGNPNHLPQSSSINKQITYGEYIYINKELKKQYGEKYLYIMPLLFHITKLITDLIQMNYI